MSREAQTVRAARRRRGKSPRSLALVEAARQILAEIQPASVRCYRLFPMGEALPNPNEDSQEAA